MVLKLEFTDYIDIIVLSAKHHEDTRVLFYAIIRNIKSLLCRNMMSYFTTDQVDGFILHFFVNDQHDAQIPFYVFIFSFNSLHVPSTSCTSSGEKNCINTTSGNSLCVGGRVVCTRNDHQHRVSYQRLY